jgi:hypothetical protein
MLDTGINKIIKTHVPKYTTTFMNGLILGGKSSDIVSDASVETLKISLNDLLIIVS